MGTYTLAMWTKGMQLYVWDLPARDAIYWSFLPGALHVLLSERHGNVRSHRELHSLTRMLERHIDFQLFFVLYVLHFLTHVHLHSTRTGVPSRLVCPLIDAAHHDTDSSSARSRAWSAATAIALRRATSRTAPWNIVDQLSLTAFAWTLLPQLCVGLLICKAGLAQATGRSCLLTVTVGARLQCRSFQGIEGIPNLLRYCVRQAVSEIPDRTSLRPRDTVKHPFGRGH